MSVYTEDVTAASGFMAGAAILLIPIAFPLEFARPSSLADALTPCKCAGREFGVKVAGTEFALAPQRRRWRRGLGAREGRSAGALVVSTVMARLDCIGYRCAWRRRMKRNAVQAPDRIA